MKQKWLIDFKLDKTSENVTWIKEINYWWNFKSEKKLQIPQYNVHERPTWWGKPELKNFSNNNNGIIDSRRARIWIMKLTWFDQIPIRNKLQTLTLKYLKIHQQAFISSLVFSREKELSRLHFWVSIII